MPTSAELHDRVDAREELRERARDIVDRVVRERFAEALEQSGGDQMQVFELLAVWAAGQLADLTTEAVASGAGAVHRG